MNEKSLLSLREIARELNLKYKKILNAKNQMEAFLPGMFDGRNFKYFPDSKEILELVTALREEGYTFSMIREILLGKRIVENDPQMYEWICECISKHKHHWTQVDGFGCARLDQSGPVQTSTDQSVPVQASMDQYGPEQASAYWSGPAQNSLDQRKPIQASADQPIPEQASANQSEPAQTSMDQSEPIQASMDLNMPVYAGMDADGFICTGMDVAGCGRANPDQDKPVQADTDQSKPECSDPDQDAPEHADSDKDGLTHSGADVAAQIQEGMDGAKEIWLKEVETLLGSLLTEQAGEIQAVLQKMATQSNIAITALCEATDDIRTAVLNLDTRLSHMEKDLGMKEADPLELYQVEAGNYQVDLPEISLPVFKDQDQGQDQAPEDDLSPVRDSITKGIPDKEMLVEWIIARREEDLQANSYSVLAAALNEAEIPTLTGRANWSKGTIRNLVVRKKAEQD
jgi:hypothetical protein